jgi:hypothetical protein
VSSRHFLLHDAANHFLFVEFDGKHSCLSPLSGIRTVLQGTEIDVATLAFISRTPGSIYWFDIGITPFVPKIHTVLKA